MDGSENNYESFTKCVSGYSHYSEPFEDFSLEIKKKEEENNNNQEISKKNSFNNNIKFLKKRLSKTTNNELNPIPEDTKEHTEENKIINSNEIQIKTSKEKSDETLTELKEDSKEKKINNLDNLNNIENINNTLNTNDLNELTDINNTLETKKFEDDLYSLKENNNSSSYIRKDSQNHDNDLSVKKESEQDINTKKLDMSDELLKIKKKNNAVFDSNKQPLDSNSFIIKKKNTQQILNLNLISTKKNNPINNVFKKFKSNEINLNQGIKEQRRGSFDGFFYSKFSGYRTHASFDLKNIIKKAVVMNGKKGKIKSSIFDSNNTNLEPKDSINTIIDNEYPINNIKFKNIQIDELSINFLKKHLRRIDIESNIKPKNRYIKTLLELQNFYIDNSSVWVIKISPDSRYLAAGCKSGKIKIYEIIGYNYTHFQLKYKKDNIMKYLNFINESPYKTLEKHKSDIIDLSWSTFYPNLLLSASFDHYICLWDISLEGNNCLVKEFENSDIVTSVSFNPSIKNLFISGSMNTFVTVWKFNYYDNILNELEDNNIINNSKIEKQIENENSEANIVNSYLKDMKVSKIKKKKKEKIEKKKNDNTFDDLNNTDSFLSEPKKETYDYFNLEHKITSISYFPDASKIGVGTENGKIYVYNTFPRVSYSNNFFVSKKKFGIFHDGKKVTGIQFIDNIHAVITTCDSLIRLVDMSIGKILYQYKGSTHKNSMTRAYADLCDDVIIIGGEDGYCYLWNLLDKDCIKNKKNNNYIKFKPYAKDLVECTLIADEKCYTNYMQKVLKLTNKIIITSIIINGTSNGKLEILLNINESFSK